MYGIFAIGLTIVAFGCGGFALVAFVASMAPVADNQGRSISNRERVGCFTFALITAVISINAGLYANYLDKLSKFYEKTAVTTKAEYVSKKLGVATPVASEQDRKDAAAAEYDLEEASKQLPHRWLPRIKFN